MNRFARFGLMLVLVPCCLICSNGLLCAQPDESKKRLLDRFEKAVGPRIFNSVPRELDLKGCWRTGPDGDEDEEHAGYVLKNGKPEKQLKAAQLLWARHTRNYIADVLQ